jgi:hypothetical protein
VASQASKNDFVAQCSPLHHPAPPPPPPAEATRHHQHQHNTATPIAY